MHRGLKIQIALIFTAIAGLLVWAAAGKIRADTWEVLTGGLSAEIGVKRASMNSVYYILKQTHEPIFRKDDGRNYASKLLVDWERSLDHSRYYFCPRAGLRFNKNKVFGFDLFLAHLKEVTAQFDPDFELLEVSGCAQVQFSKSREGYLDYLSLYETAPTASRGDGTEDGLGPYEIESVSEKKIVLVRKKFVSRGYNRIIFHERSEDKDPLLEGRNISDFNRIPSYDVPDWVKKDYVKFDNVELNAIVLMINHPDRDVRQAVYNCFAIDEFRAAFVPKRSKFYDIQTVFPLGVPGAIPGKPEQACVVDRQKLARVSPLIFANWSLDNHEQLSAYLKGFQEKTGLRIILKNYSPEKLGRIVYNRPKPYNLIVIVFDAVRPEDTTFLEAYFRKDNYHDISFAHLRPKYLKLLYEHNPTKRTALGCEIADGIGESRAALPLYQNMGTLYYPARIKNLNVGRGFLEYPEVGEFRW
jgi:hypothetical protein